MAYGELPLSPTFKANVTMPCDYYDPRNGLKWDDRDFDWLWRNKEPLPKPDSARNSRSFTSQAITQIAPPKYRAPALEMAHVSEQVNRELTVPQKNVIGPVVTDGTTEVIAEPLFSDPSHKFIDTDSGQSCHVESCTKAGSSLEASQALETNAVRESGRSPQNDTVQPQDATQTTDFRYSISNPERVSSNSVTPAQESKEPKGMQAQKINQESANYLQIPDQALQAMEQTPITYSSHEVCTTSSQKTLDIDTYEDHVHSNDQELSDDNSSDDEIDLITSTPQHPCEQEMELESQLETEPITTSQEFPMLQERRADDPSYSQPSNSPILSEVKQCESESSVTGPLGNITYLMSTRDNFEQTAPEPKRNRPISSIEFQSEDILTARPLSSSEIPESSRGRLTPSNANIDPLPQQEASSPDHVSHGNGHPSSGQAEQPFKPTDVARSQSSEDPLSLPSPSPVINKRAISSSTPKTPGSNPNNRKLNVVAPSHKGIQPRRSSGTITSPAVTRRKSTDTKHAKPPKKPAATRRKTLLAEDTVAASSPAPPPTNTKSATSPAVTRRMSGEVSQLQVEQDDEIDGKAGNGKGKRQWVSCESSAIAKPEVKKVRRSGRASGTGEKTGRGVEG